VNTRNGVAFNLFEAARFPDDAYPMYIHECPHSRQDIVFAVAKALYYRSYDELSLSNDTREQMKIICKQHGFDLDAPNFDPAIYG
jgi:hypothetical protein